MSSNNSLVAGIDNLIMDLGAEAALNPHEDAVANIVRSGRF